MGSIRGATGTKYEGSAPQADPLLGWLPARSITVAGEEKSGTFGEVLGKSRRPPGPSRC